MFKILPEPDTRIKYDVILSNSCGRCSYYPLPEKLTDLLHDICVVRIFLHRPGHPLHMHDNEPGSVSPDNPRHTVVAQSRNIVYDMSSRTKNLFCYLGFCGI